mmetsp:Transcript_4249/g.7105  ORF Transcript_4249/g.7105 Transcript_4249/m.7105 type:complete len:233 (-) Transcript_4249:66-764(-)
MRSVVSAIAFFCIAVDETFASNAAGLAFLERNKDKPGVIVLPSGLQYKVIRAGSGSDHPTVDSPCECHYEGRTAQEFEKDPTGSNTFDGSYARGSPTTFAPNQVIKGWTEAMQLMVEGDKFELYIPSEMAYGERGSGAKIKGGDVLVFTIEILKIKGGKKPASKCDVQTLDGCKEKEAVYVTAKKELGSEGIEKELTRLQGMAGKKMASEKMVWVSNRIVLLNKLLKLKEEL